MTRKRPTIRSPKRVPVGARWYDYYAGYSVEFVEDTLSYLLDDSSGRTVLDPWNGSGTTTIVAAGRGQRAIGYDLNPALTAIAKGRHLPKSVGNSLLPLTEEIIALASQFSAQDMFGSSDPLTTWFGPTTVNTLRSLERATARTLVDHDLSMNARVDVDSLSTLAGFYYCALFRVVRDLTLVFRTSNPTWVKRPNATMSLIGARSTSIRLRLVEAVEELAERLTLQTDPPAPGVRLETRSADDLPNDLAVDLVLTSPPYGTRIDYIVATLPELAILGVGQDQLQELRIRMLGTPRLGIEKIDYSDVVGDYATRFLKKVEKHPSKASTGYYLRYFTSYLRGLQSALGQAISRTRQGGAIALVVQDSYYKNVHFDLPRLVAEFGQILGLASERVDFKVKRTKAAIHPTSKNYRDTFGAVESLVILTK
jgi:hypothetical protein